MNIKVTIITEATGSNTLQKQFDLEIDDASGGDLISEIESHIHASKVQCASFGHGASNTPKE